MRICEGEGRASPCSGWTKKPGAKSLKKSPNRFPRVISDFMLEPPLFMGCGPGGPLCHMSLATGFSSGCRAGEAALGGLGARLKPILQVEQAAAVGVGGPLAAPGR